MPSVIANVWRTRVISNVVTGSLVLLPLVLTVLIIGWIINTLVALLGPETWFGGLLTSGGAAIVGEKLELIAFLIGASIGLFGLWLLGLTIRAQAQRTLDQVLDGLLARVPLFRTIYRPVSQVVRVFAGSKAELVGLPVVMCRFGGEGGADVPAFLASPEAFQVKGERRLVVYLPTSPVPAWGGLVMVPEESVIPVPEMEAEALIKLYFSFGVLAPEVLPRTS